jgi:hypothetical protein
LQRQARAALQQDIEALWQRKVAWWNAGRYISSSLRDVLNVCGSIVLAVPVHQLKSSGADAGNNVVEVITHFSVVRFSCDFRV